MDDTRQIKCASMHKFNTGQSDVTYKTCGRIWVSEFLAQFSCLTQLSQPLFIIGIKSVMKCMSSEHVCFSFFWDFYYAF
jgi:hypothetical protein